MNWSRTSTKLIVTVVVLVVLGTTIIAVTQRTGPPVTSVPVCVKDDGQLRVVTDKKNSCGPSEHQMDWVVGGEVTDIRFGQGLIGSREDGSVSVSLDPEIIAGCTGCRGGRVFAGFKDGPFLLPHVLENAAPQATLDLPAGSYAIFAKLIVENSNDDTPQVRVVCRLQAEADSDDGAVGLTAPNSPDGLNMEVVHRFDSPGSVTLTCGRTTLGSAAYRDLKIIAMEASHVSNVFLP